MSNRLKGKRAFVTAAAAGIGRASAIAFAREGATVFATDIDEKGLATLANEGIAEVARLDVRDTSAVMAMAKRAGPTDILLNAAGINSATPFFEIAEEEWQRILDVNLKSMLLACQVFGKAMVDAGRGGSIINISSASSGPPLSKVFTYSISKGGVNQLTQFLARELAPHKVRVNAIAPGFIPAEQNRKVLTEDRVARIMAHTPAGRFGDPSEMVGAAVWLASERAASFVTGAIIRVDGGFTAMTI